MKPPTTSVWINKVQRKQSVIKWHMLRNEWSINIIQYVKQSQHFIFWKQAKLCGCNHFQKKLLFGLPILFIFSKTVVDAWKRHWEHYDACCKSANNSLCALETNIRVCSVTMEQNQNNIANIMKINKQETISQFY